MDRARSWLLELLLSQLKMKMYLPASECVIGAMAKVLPFLFTVTVVFLTKSTLTMLSPNMKKIFGIANLSFHLSCFEVLFYIATKSLPSAIKLFLRSNFLQTICGRKSSEKKTSQHRIMEICLTCQVLEKAFHHQSLTRL